MISRFPFQSIYFVFVILGLLFFISIIYYVRDVLFPFFLGLLIAYSLDPLVKKIEKNNYFRISRSYTVVLIFLIFFSGNVYILSKFSILFTNNQQILNTLTTVIEDIRNYIFFVENYIMEQHFGKSNFFNLEEMSLFLIQEFENFVKTFLMTLTNWTFYFFNEIILFILTPISVYYFLKDKKFFLEKIRICLPIFGSKKTLEFLKEIDLKIGNYIKTQLWISFIVFILTTFFLFIFPKVRAYSLIFGIVSGLTNIVPYIGPVVGSIFPLFFLFYFYGFKIFFLGFLFFFVLHAFTGFVLIPKMTSTQVKIHPLSVFLALSLGKFFLGIIGMLIAVPTMLIIIELFKTIFKNQAIHNYYNSLFIKK